MCGREALAFQHIVDTTRATNDHLGRFISQQLNIVIGGGAANQELGTQVWKKTANRINNLFRLN